MCTCTYTDVYIYLELTIRPTSCPGIYIMIIHLHKSTTIALNKKEDIPIHYTYLNRPTNRSIKL